MDPSLRLQQQIAMEKYEALNVMEKHRVMARMDALARDKGYDGQMDLKNKKPHIWEQMCAQVVRELFP